MTREEKLYAMNGATLIQIANKLGVKVYCNKTGTKLVEAKSKAIERILAAEAAAKKEEKKPVEKKPAAKKAEEKKPAAKKPEKKPVEKKEAVASPGRGAMIEYDGKSQNICKWGEELGISPNTLYGRIYKMGWSIERAFTTKPRKSK